MQNPTQTRFILTRGNKGNKISGTLSRTVFFFLRKIKSDLIIKQLGLIIQGKKSLNNTVEQSESMLVLERYNKAKHIYFLNVCKSQGTDMKNSPNFHNQLNSAEVLRQQTSEDILFVAQFPLPIFEKQSIS